MYNVDFDSSAPVFENHTNFNIDNVVPEKRNNTYGSDAVHRKSMNELLSTSFSEDQQKVLAYALEHISGGGESDIFTVNVTIDAASSQISPTVDKTFDEIKSALVGGKNVLAKVQMLYQGALFGVSSIAQVAYSQNEDVIKMASIGYQCGSEKAILEALTVTELSINSNNAITIVTYHGEFFTAK